MLDGFEDTEIGMESIQNTPVLEGVFKAQRCKYEWLTLPYQLQADTAKPHTDCS
jgi:hypothetical protein